jgi:hypothetical protein
MAVISRTAATLGVQVNGDDSGGVSADDIGPHQVADVNHLRRLDSGVRERGAENRGIWLGGSYHRGVDDAADDRSLPRPGLADTSVTEILSRVSVRIGHNHDSDPGPPEVINCPHRVWPGFAPQDLARAAAISEFGQGADRIPHTLRWHAQFVAQRSEVIQPFTVDVAAIKLPHRPVMSTSHTVPIANDPDLFEGSTHQIAARKHDDSASIEEHRVAGKPA